MLDGFLWRHEMEQTNLAKLAYYSMISLQVKKTPKYKDILHSFTGRGSEQRVGTIDEKTRAQTIEELERIFD